jgi:hypothetical protein
MKIKHLLREGKTDKDSSEKKFESVKEEIKLLKYDKLRITTLTLLIDCFYKKTKDDIELTELKNMVIDVENSK